MKVQASIFLSCTLKANLTSIQYLQQNVTKFITVIALLGENHQIPDMDICASASLNFKDKIRGTGTSNTDT